jgi:L-lactate permease
MPGSIFNTTLEAFGAIGLPVTGFSSFAAFVRTVERASSERLADAVNHGIAVGFVPGAALAAIVFVNGVRS